MSVSSQTPTMRERRRRERFATSGLTASCAGVPIEVRNLSLAGLSFETESRLMPGGAVNVKIGSDLGELKVKGRVVWSRMVGSVTAPDGAVHPRYQGGVRFDPLAELDGEILVELVARLWKGRDLG